MSGERPMYVGIDLGTTNSAAAVFDGERVELVRTAQGGHLTPSVVRIDARGKVMVGERARKLFDQDPDNVRSEFKRLMGSGQSVHFPGSGQHKKPEELGAEVLRSIRADIQAQFGFLPQRAVISVPALFELPQTAATSEAARLAGFERVEMIQEPVASGLGAGFRVDDEPGSYLVYDLGGGTFDASLLEARDGLLRVVGHDGDNFLGGRDFDTLMLDYVLSQLSASHDLVLDRGNPAHATALRRLRAATEEAKIELSRNEAADIFIPELRVGDRQFEVSLTLSRATLEERVEPLVARSIAVCQRLLVASGLPLQGALRRVILVGGPTMMPLLRKQVLETLGAPFGVGLDPMTLVAEGAAYYAASVGLTASAVAASPSAGAKVWLQHPAMSSDLSPFVVGKLLDPADVAQISHVVLSSADGSWSSAPEPLDRGGSFAVMVKLKPRAVNVLSVVGQHRETAEPVPLSPGELTIVHGMTLGDPPLSRSVGVALANSHVRVFFERGCPLPTRRSFTLRTVQALSPADPDGALRVPIVQGEFRRASLCRLVGGIEIAARELKAALPANAQIEVTIELDRGGRLAASAVVSDTAQVFQQVVQLVAGRVPLTEVAGRLQDLSKRTQELRARAFKHGAQSAVKQLLAADALVNDGRALELAARGGDPDAEEKVQRLLVDLDGALSEAETLLGWPEVDDQVSRAIASATIALGEHGTSDERKVLANTIASIERARAALNLDDVQRHLATIRSLRGAVEMREDGAWEDQLDWCVSRVHQTRDPKAALVLIDAGRRAIADRNQAALESSVRSLWQLMPYRDDVRAHSHGSGVA